MCPVNRRESGAACCCGPWSPWRGSRRWPGGGGVTRLTELARGPGRLTQALGIDKRLDGIDLCREGPLWLGEAELTVGEIGDGQAYRDHPGGGAAAAVL